MEILMVAEVGQTYTFSFWIKAVSNDVTGNPSQTTEAQNT